MTSAPASSTASGGPLRAFPPSYSKILARAVRQGLAAALLLGSLAATGGAAGRSPPRGSGEGEAVVAIELKAQPLGESLRQMAEAFGLKIAFFSESIDGLRAPRLVGLHSPAEALDALLKGTGLEYAYVDASSVVVRTRSVPNTTREVRKGKKKSKRSEATTGNRTDRHGKAGGRRIAAGTLLAGGVRAQDEPPEDSGVIEEVMVTATHRQTSLMDTPVSVSAVNADAIDQLGATDVHGLYRALPGLNAASEATGSNRMTIRGITSQTGTSSSRQTSATIGVYIDDTPMTSHTGPHRQLAGALFDVQRVEVLKGPQGTLFGEGAQGGTIRYIYNEPDRSGLDYRAQAGAFLQRESDDTGYRIDGMLNIPLSENSALRLTAFQDDAAGWIDKNNLTPAEEDVNSASTTGGRIAAKWWPSERFTAQASIFVVDSENDASAHAYRAYEENLNPRVTHNPASSEDEFSLYSLRLDYDFGFAALTSVTSYYERDARAMTEYDVPVVWFLDAVYGLLDNLRALGAGEAPLSPCNPGPQDALLSNALACPWGDGASMLAYGIDSSSETERFIQEIRLVSASDGPLLWTAGLFYKTTDDLRADPQQALWAPGREWVQCLWANLFASPPITPGYPMDDYLTTLDEVSGFAEATYALSDAWSITAGARVAGLKQKFGYVDHGTDDTVVSPKATLAWRPTDDQLYYFGYASGFRPGNVNNTMEFNRRQLGGAIAQESLDRFVGNLTFDGDRLESYELGAKLSLADGRAQVIAAAYYQKWTDMITEFHDPELVAFGVTQFNNNAGDAHSQGIELEFNWELADGLLLRFAGDINESETDEDNVDYASYQVPKGSKLVYAPEWSLSASVDYRFDLPANLEGRLRVDHQRVAEQFIWATNDLSLDKYDLTSLRFGIASRTDRHWTASIFIDNLFNDEVILNKAARRDFQFGGSIACVYARPRMIGLQFSLGTGN